MSRVPGFRRNPSVTYLVLLAGVVIGVAADRAGWLPGSARTEPADARRTFGPFWEAWRLAERYYVDRAAVKPQEMMRGAVEGMLASLGDVGHTEYLTPGEFKEMTAALEGHFEGIGARITVRKGQPTVAATLPDSPARKAGLRAGDVLVTVNGRDVRTLSLQRLVETVRGPAGTEVRLGIRRAHEAGVIEVTVRRAKVKLVDVSWHLLPGTPVAHVAIHDFGMEADAQLRAALQEARGAGALALLVDVRGNPGGLKEQAVAVSSEFLADGNVFLERNAKGDQTAVPVRPGGRALDIPACVLIDGGTASAAEIFAGAMQDHRRGKLVGTRTFGTGTVLKPFELSDGSAVLLAVVEWLTPNGRQIWHQGIAPDVEVNLPADAALLLPDDESGLSPEALAKAEDRQVLEGLKVLEGELKTRPVARRKLSPSEAPK